MGTSKSLRVCPVGAVSKITRSKPPNQSLGPKGLAFRVRDGLRHRGDLVDARRRRLQELGELREAQCRRGAARQAQGIQPQRQALGPRGPRA